MFLALMWFLIRVSPAWAALIRVKVVDAPDSNRGNSKIPVWWVFSELTCPLIELIGTTLTCVPS
jgi:hypothetical protein